MTTLTAVVSKSDAIAAHMLDDWSVGEVLEFLESMRVAVLRVAGERALPVNGPVKGTTHTSPFAIPWRR